MSVPMRTVKSQLFVGILMSRRCGQSCILCNILDFCKSRCGTTQECETLMGLGWMSDDMLNSTNFDK